jgi:uncharacterized protein YgfB (UPF0149 family)
MKSRPFLLATCAAVAAGVGLAVPTPSNGQAGDSPEAIEALIIELGAQQTVVTENQAKIDAKLAAIAEDLRVARIFVARGGGKAKPNENAPTLPPALHRARSGHKHGQIPGGWREEAVDHAPGDAAEKP